MENLPRAYGIPVFESSRQPAPEHPSEQVSTGIIKMMARRYVTPSPSRVTFHIADLKGYHRPRIATAKGARMAMDIGTLVR